MSPKNAIKIINIQKSYSVHIGSIQSIMFSSIQFGLIQSYSVLFSPCYPLKFYLVYFGPFNLIQSTSLLFGPFGPHLFYSVHSVHYSPIQFKLVLFGPFCLLWSYSIQIDSIQSSLSTTVQYAHFGPTVQFGPVQSILSTLLLFGPLGSYSVHLVPIRSIRSLFHLVQFFSIVFIVVTLLLNHINVTFQSTSV